MSNKTYKYTLEGGEDIERIFNKHYVSLLKNNRVE